MSSSSPSISARMQRSLASSATANKKLAVIIIGGSTTGLSLGLLLKRQGHDVTILEQCTWNARDGTAAGINLITQVKQLFDEHDHLRDQLPLGKVNKILKVVNGLTLKVRRHSDHGAIMTTWEATYYRLRANFDGFSSTYCPASEIVAEDAVGGTAKYLTSQLVSGVQPGDNDSLLVQVHGLGDGNMVYYRGDIVIAADGANSIMHRQLAMNVETRADGYLVWRGTVPVKDLSSECRAVFSEGTVTFSMARSYAVIYTIPGENGSLSDDKLRINFEWYSWPKEGEHIHEILTDSDGHCHADTVPKGMMLLSVWLAQLERGKKEMHPLLYEIMEKIREPFVSVCSSQLAAQGAFFDNRLFLIGDALGKSQPHAGIGTAMAVTAAKSLADLVGKRDKSKPEKWAHDVAMWERDTLEVLELERLRSIALASGYLHGWWRSTVDSAKYHIYAFKHKASRVCRSLSAF